MSNEIKKISVFCVREQKETDHTLDIDQSGELVLTCTSNVGTDQAPETCGRFIKYPKGTTAEELKGHLATHKIHNEGQVSLEASEAMKNKILDEFNKTE